MAYKPMLAPHESPLKYANYFQDIQKRLPLLASPKLDGIRCIVKSRQSYIATSDFEMVPHGEHKDVCLSRTLLDIPSAQVQQLFSPFTELDGELIVGDETDFGVCNRTQSYVMSDNKVAEQISYRVFDCADEAFAGDRFENRLEYAADRIEELHLEFPDSNVSIVEHTLCETLDDVLEYEEWALDLGYEGIMLRDPAGRYKHNRGTWKEGLIHKLKREQDDEFEIAGFVEATTNTNEQVRDARGYAKRSHSLEGKILSGTLGKLLVMYKEILVPVSCGALTHIQRQEIWNNPERYLGATITVRHFPHGQKILLRHPRFICFRDKKYM